MIANVAQLLRRSARERGEHVAIIDAGSGARVRWAELDRATDALAGGLRVAGYPRGSRAALVFGNSVDFVTGYFGVLRAGLVAVPVNNGYTRPEIERVLTDSAAAVVLAGPAAADVVRAAVESTAGEPDRPDLVVAGSAEWDRLISTGPAGGPEDPDGPEDPAGGPEDPDGPALGGEELAVLAFTSGTSGAPKGAMLSHRALLASVESTLALEPAPMRPDDVVLLSLPLFHIYALNGILGPLAAVGATAVLTERFDPERTLALIEQHRITNVPGVPAMYAAWAARPELPAAMRTVRLLVSGSAPLPRAVFEQIRGSTGLTVYEGYGLTETAPAATSTLASDRVKPGSIGRPVPGVEVRLVGEAGEADEVDEAGEPAAEGDPGELQLRGANLFSGYWPGGSGRPGPDGWWPTGDVAYADEDGDLFLVDRRKELVLVNGFNVYPREVEAVLAEHPDVAEAAVVAVPDPDTGEAVKAFVVPRPGATLTREGLIAYCEPRLARFKRPTIIAIVAELPHSVTGKVAKARLVPDRAAPDQAAPDQAAPDQAVP